MVSVNDVETQEFIRRVAEGLEKMNELSPPPWSRFVKTGISRMRPPQQKNWWWIRSASMLRKVYLEQGIGVSELRKVYGGRMNRGHKPEHKYRSSGSIIRKILQQLEAAGFVKKDKGGRKITPKGRAFLNEIAKSMK